MSDAQREVSNALLDDIFGDWVSGVAASRGKSEAAVLALLDDAQGVATAQALEQGGWISGTRYLDQITALLRPRAGGRAAEPGLRTIDARAYGKRTSPRALGLDAGPPSIAILRAAGAISRGRAGGPSLRGGGSGITNEDFIDAVKRLRADRRVRAVVLRVDSPGGDALASDLMWRELRLLAAAKPVVASMGDVAASGGYYMAMACDRIVAERLTLTGSIGVVTGKFNLAELFKRVGFTREVISRGRFAQVDVDNRGFTPEEEAYFDRNAASAYASFRDKAALSRGMAVDAMEALAQGRVWTGRQAHERGLVDSLGGLQDAVAVAKALAGFKPSDRVSAAEVGRRWSPLGAPAAALATVLSAARVLSAAEGLATAAAGGAAGLLTGGAGGAVAPMALMDELTVGGFSAGGLGFELEAALPASVAATGRRLDLLE